jgi:hypothetical protein
VHQPTDHILVPLRESQRLLCDPTPANIDRCTVLLSGAAATIRCLLENPEGVSHGHAASVAAEAAIVGSLLESAAAFRAAAFREAAGAEA